MDLTVRQMAGNAEGVAVDSPWRRTVVMGIGATTGVAAVGGIALGTQASSGPASSAPADSPAR
ncbi:MULTISPECIES: hypothetical protein [unclassified Streptomyces]|uniref:hypothetical protein n=1 Tax=unclassified Streptomyces TaxID=2593676 RepID=UPI0030099582